MVVISTTIAPTAMDWIIRDEQSASGGQYRGASPDGSRPGVFFANAYDLSLEWYFSEGSLLSVAGFIKDMRDISYGYVNYRVVERIEVDGFPQKADGFVSPGTPN